MNGEANERKTNNQKQIEVVAAIESVPFKQVKGTQKPSSGNETSKQTPNNYRIVIGPHTLKHLE